MKNRKFIAVALPLVALTFGATAHAQQTNNRQNNPQNNNRGLFPLPAGIAQIIAVDAHNGLLAETDGENGAPRQYFGIEVRHIYAGAIARLFGGEVIPTAPFVSPYFNRNNGFGNQGANGGFGNQGFGNQGFGNNFNNGMR